MFMARLLAGIVRSAWASLRGLGSGKWPKTDAVVTSNSERQDILDGTVVEIAYSDRAGGELYTGFHAAPGLLNEAEYRPRFRVGRTFVARVKPEEPQLSLLRDDDQVDGVAQRLAGRGAK
jgi:hypothetical protein